MRRFLLHLARHSTGEALAPRHQEIDPGAYTRVTLILSGEDDMNAGIEIGRCHMIVLQHRHQMTHGQFVTDSPERLDHHAGSIQRGLGEDVGIIGPQSAGSRRDAV